VLGNRASIDAVGTGEPDAALGQVVARELVGAGANRLDETEPLCPIEELVLSPEITSTSASPTRFSKVWGSRTAKLLMPVSSAENRSCSR
jgi:hypothetical protein